MSEENVTTPEAEAVEEETPSAEVVTETEETPEETEVVPPEPKDNAERSRLGRKVAELEMNLERALDTINQMSTKPTQPEGLDFGDDLGFDDDDEEISFRKGDLRKDIVNVLNKVLPKSIPKILEQKSQAQNEYERKALIAISRIGSDLPEDEFNAIAESLGKTFNRYTGNPELDAKTNFLEARVAVLEKGKRTKKNPLKGETPKAPLGGGGGETPPSKKTITLSAEMKAWQKKFGLSDEAAARAAKQVNR